MREGGNSQDGKVKRDAFKRILNAHFENTKESLIEDLFDRKHHFVWVFLHINPLRTGWPL